MNPEKFRSRRKENCRALATPFLIFVALAAATAYGTPPALAAEHQNSATADDLAVYLGVLPARMVQGHGVKHTGARMHGGVPGGRHDHHVAVAIFDAASGERIEGAEITATISGLGCIGGTVLPLDPMSSAGTITCGQFVSFPGSGRYTIALEIRRSGEDASVHFEFDYRQGAS